MPPTVESSTWPLNRHNCSENYTKAKHHLFLSHLNFVWTAESQFGFNMNVISMYTLPGLIRDDKIYHILYYILNILNA